MDAAVNLAYGMSRICRGAASGSTIGAPGRTDAAANKLRFGKAWFIGQC
jgi:hypothetical protein